MAIAFDASATGVQASGTSLTFAHTCTGSNRILIVSAFTNSTSDQITGVTYAGVAMTRGTTFAGAPGAGGLSLYYLLSPSTGANNVIISANATTYIRGQSSSYTGAGQLGQPDSNASGTYTSVNVFTASTTVVASNCWTIAACAAGAGSFSGYSAQSRQATSEPMTTQDSNTTISTGSQSLTFNCSSTTNATWAMMSFSPPGSVVPKTSLSLLGVG